jgi:hypothetical protein
LKEEEMTKRVSIFNHFIRILLMSLFVIFLLVITPAQPVLADTYIVTNTNDSGLGSLRQAITDANNNPGPDTITFAPAINGIPIVLSGAAGEDANASGDLDILDGGDLTIQGNGAANTIIDGGGIDRVFHNCPSVGCTNTVTLSGITIRNGSVTGSGGGICNRATFGTLIVDNSTISGNTAEWGGGIYNWEDGTLNVQNGSIVSANTARDVGGGIYNEATLTVTNSTIGGVGAGNTAVGAGGGIYNHWMGTTTMDGSTVSDNTAGKGGGIYQTASLGTTTVNGSTISGNMATTSGGGIYSSLGTTTVDGSTISDNTAEWGGGIYNRATLNVQNGSTIGGVGAGNTATTSGGGIYNSTAGTTTVDGSTISDNTAGWGGGIYNRATLNVQNGSTIGGTGAGNTATTSGGGIYNSTAGTTTVDGSTVSANTAGWGGGIYNWEDGTLNVQNGSIVSANTAPIGGGIFNRSGTTTVDGSTVSGNTAANGGGIHNDATLIVQNNSSISANTASWGGGGITNDHGNSTTVTGSRIMNNEATYGGGIFNISGSAGVTNVTGSCLVGNITSALRNNSDSQQIATGNWWGATTGPNTPGADTVVGNVDTSGYLTEPILGCGFYVYLPLIMR